MARACSRGLSRAGAAPISHPPYRTTPDRTILLVLFRIPPTVHPGRFDGKAVFQNIRSDEDGGAVYNEGKMR